MKKLCLAAAFSLFSAFANADTLRVGTEPTFAPFEYVVDGQIVGFDIDLIKAIAEVEGLDIEIVSTPFDAQIPSIMTGQIQIAASGVSITEERAKAVLFSDPYYESGISAVIRKSDEAKYPSLDSLKGKRLCAQIGTTGANVASSLSEDVATFNTTPEAFMELGTNGCEATLNDRPVNAYFLNKFGSDKFSEIAQIANGENYGFVAAKGSDELISKINDGLSKVKANGTYDKIYNKWFSTSVE